MILKSVRRARKTKKYILISYVSLKIRSVQAKVLYFFSRKSSWLIHLLKKSKILLFFPARREKNYSLFFPKKKFMGHSLNFWQGLTFFIYKSGLYFFSRISVCFFCIFFPMKSSYAIHSFDLNAVFFSVLFHPSNRFFPKVW